MMPPAPVGTVAALAATLARVSALDPYLAGGVGRDTARDPAGWVTPAELCREDGATLDRMLAAIGAHSKTVERRVQAAFLIGGYAWYVLAPVLGAYLLERRVPSLGHDDVSVWLSPGDAPGCLALRTGRFSVLAEAPAADTRYVRVVPDETALRDMLHDEIVDHMSPIVGAVRARIPLSARAQWLEVADRVGSALHLVGRSIGEEERGIHEAESLVHRPGSPLDSPRSRFVTYEHLGQRRTVKLRGACCLSYRIAAQGYCMTCPLIGEEERGERVRAWLTEDLSEAADAAI